MTELPRHPKIELPELDADTLTLMAEAALNDAQYERIAALSPPVRERVRNRLLGALRFAVRAQLICACREVHPVALERIIQEETVQESLERELERERDAQALALLQAGASSAMIGSLLNIKSVKAYLKRLRETYKDCPESSLGRHKIIPDTLSVAIYRYWDSLGKPCDVEGFLKLAQQFKEQGVTLHSIWNLVQDWLHADACLKRYKQEGAQ